MEQNLKKKGFILVLIGAVFECAWVYGLKYADSSLTYTLTVIAVLCSTFFFLNAYKFLPTSVAYIFYIGLGTAFVVITEIAITGEFDILRVCCIITLLIGIYGLQKGGKDA